MKFSSLLVTLSCTSVLAVSSLEAKAELLDSEVKSDSPAYATQLTKEELSYQHLEQDSHSQQNSQTRAISSGYSVYSFAKDKQITLQNIQQPLALEDVEWYIEKY